MKLRITVELDDGTEVEVERNIAEPSTVLGLANTAGLLLMAMSEDMWRELTLL